MKTGIFNWFGHVMPIEERLECIREAGFDSVMLWWEDEDYPKFIDKSTFVSLAKDKGLLIDNIHLPYEECNTLWSDSCEAIEKYICKVFNWLEGSKSSGADKVVMHTNRSDIAYANFKNGYKSFEKIVKYAENIKLKIAVENTSKFSHTEFILVEFISPYLGFCYDSSHDFINGESKGEILLKWKDRLFCLHLSDTDGITDRHWLPTKGNVDFKKIIDIVRLTNCNTLSMEVYPYGDEKQLPPKEFLKMAFELNKKFLH